MPISTDSLYAPLNAFFLGQFAGGPSTQFRFARHPQSFYASDFLLPGQEAAGPSDAVAQELLSGVADAIVRLDDDGKSLWTSPRAISALYHDEMLEPAVTAVPDGTDAACTQALLADFGTIKGQAELDWQGNRRAGLLSAATFCPVVARPSTWWQDAAPAWTHRRFEIDGAVQAGGPAAEPIMKLKVSDEVLRTVMIPHLETAPPPVHPMPPEVVLRRPMAGPLAVNAMAAAQVAPARQFTAVAPQRPVLAATVMPPMNPPAPQPVNSAAMHAVMLQRYDSLAFTERMSVQSSLADAAPAAGLQSDAVTIDFDFVLVAIDRPWLDFSLVDATSWRVPGRAKGDLSANDGVGLPALPIGFVVIRNLVIKPPLTAADISNLNNSIQFGPFNLSSTVVDGAIGRKDMQIIGWVLQDMPALPPN